MQDYARLKADQVWADEPNVMVRFERDDATGCVWITLLDMEGSPIGKPKATAQLGGWRWDRVVQALSLAPASEPASSARRPHRAARSAKNATAPRKARGA